MNSYTTLCHGVYTAFVLLHNFYSRYKEHCFPRSLRAKCKGTPIDSIHQNLIVVLHVLHHKVCPHSHSTLSIYTRVTSLIDTNFVPSIFARHLFHHSVLLSNCPTVTSVHLAVLLSGSQSVTLSTVHLPYCGTITQS